MAEARKIIAASLAAAFLAFAPHVDAQLAPRSEAAAQSNELEAARAPLRAALSAATRAHGRDHADTIAARDALITHLMNESEPPRETEALISQALASAGRRNDQAARATHYAQLARYQEGRGENSVEAWQGHVAATNAIPDVEYIDRSFALRELAAGMSAAGDRDGAVRTYQQAISIVEAEVGADHPETADALRALAVEYFSWDTPESLAAAEPLYQRAVAIVRAAPDVRPRTRAYIVSDYAEFLLAQYRYREALPLLMAVIADLTAVDQRHSLLRYRFRDLGTAAEAIGLYVEAGQLYEQALELAERSSGGGGSTTGQRLLHRDIARTLTFAGRYDDATAHLRRALELADDTPTSRRSGLRALARHHERAGQWDEAAAIHERLIALASTSAPEPDEEPQDNETRMLMALRDLARVRLAQGRPADAEVHVRRAIAIVSGWPDGSLASLNNDLAVTLLAQGRADAQTLALFDSAYAGAAATSGSRPIIAENRLWTALATNAPTDVLLRRVADIRARTQGASVLAATRNSEALETAALVIRAELQLDTDPALSADARRTAFRGLQSAYYSETSRAMAEAAAERAAAGEQAALVTQWRLANSEAGALEIQLDDLRSVDESSPAINELEPRLERAQSRRRDAETALSFAFPRFFEFISQEPVRLEIAQGLLGEDEALILLYPGEMALPEGHRNGAVFAVTRERTAFAELPLDPAQLRTTITALQRSLRTSSAPRAPNAAAAAGAPRPYDRAAAHALYRALFGAAEVTDLIGNKQRWTIVPYGELLNTPFAALVTAPPSGNGMEARALRSTAWLGTTRWLTIAPSVAVLRSQRADQVAPLSRDVAFFGLGDPSFEGAPAERGGAATRVGFIADTANIDLAAIRGLARLPGTRVEIEGLAREFRATENDYVLGDAANEAEITARNADQRLLRADVIAFATHGLVAGRLGGALIEPSLALTPPQSVTPGNDGLLSASEAARLRLRARWVILSACDTAAGGAPDAAGLTGLARAFFYAGARALLVSQWPVDDTAAQELTTVAVRLQQRAAAQNRTMTQAEAMQLSMVALMNNETRDGGDSFAHPRMWAPFLLVTGDL